MCFVEPGAPDYVAEAFSEDALNESRLFDVQAVRGLYGKCSSRARNGKGGETFSNADNMAIVGILSTQLLHAQFVEDAGTKRVSELQFEVVFDRIRPYSH